jgi:hypothetical protein
MRKKIIVLSVLLMLLQSCALPSSFGGEGNRSDYKIPEPPGPIRQVGNSYQINPKTLDRYLINPGIGWQDGPERYGVVGFPGTIAYSDRQLISWAILNPEEGIYDWTALDRQIAQAVNRREQYSFRIYTMIGEEFGEHQVPLWVLSKGATLLENGEPDYADCVYQAEWSRFVNELINKYDGNPDIAFIDISGYGNFNEWSWQDEQTEWDEDWDSAYQAGIAAPQNFTTLDGQARRRLADIFIGGSFQGHSCRIQDGLISQIGYSYDGFQKTQLVMPYAGIVQSAQYVFLRRQDVGVRYDCLGYDGQNVFSKLEDILLEVWMTAPVVFEMCIPQNVDVEDAKWLLRETHGSVVHNNNWQYDNLVLEDMMRYAGYRYFLKEATVLVEENKLNLGMEWQNLGYSPAYPKMGQDFHLYVYLLDYEGYPVFNRRLDEDISTWMPASTLPEDQNYYNISDLLEIPSDVGSGKYLLAVSIIDDRTGGTVKLAMGGRDENGYYVLMPVDVK